MRIMSDIDFFVVFKEIYGGDMYLPVSQIISSSTISKKKGSLELWVSVCWKSFAFSEK